MRFLLTLFVLVSTLLAVNATTTTWQCGKTGAHKFSPAQIKKTLALAKKTKPPGDNPKIEYPHAFHNLGKIKFNKKPAKTGKLMEFPIFKVGMFENPENGLKTKKTRPGDHRLIYSKDKGTFVGIITHADAKKGQFLPCGPVDPKKKAPLAGDDGSKKKQQQKKLKNNKLKNKKRSNMN